MATFTYESIKNRFKNPTVDGNLDLLDDGGIIKVGADDDLQITHSGSAATITNSTGDTTLDLAGDLIIDVDGADILLKDAGTQFGGFSNSSGHLQIKDGTTTFLTGNGNDATFADTLAVTGVLTADAGVNIDNITIDGTEIDLSSGDLTVDVAGDIILDADGGDVFVKDAGTTYGSLTNSSGNLIIKSGTTTAATFSGANVTFAGTVSDANGNLAQAAYPVGAVFIAVVATNPSSLLGFGTWSAFGAGKMLVGFDSSDSDFDAAEETGGAKTHTLSIAEMPAHNHPRGSNPAGAGFTDDAGTGGLEGYMGGDQATGSFNAKMALEGGGEAHNNMPPFITVYMWKRTA
tara:strand:+ start:1094 stop:2134 length:1041 start_codon:yes stop_codon:yes gene_type:complete